MKKKLTLILLSIMMVNGILSAQENKNSYTTKFGEYKLILLSEGQQQGNTGILLKATPEMLKEYAPDGKFPNATNTFLLQTGNKNILFDTGFGKLLFDHLKALGLTANDIDEVLLTHMHGDHIGGLLIDGKAAFPNAKLYIAQLEYEYWSDKENIQAILKAYEGKVELFEPNELNNITISVLPGIKAIAAYGHTPGHAVFEIGSGKDKLLIWGDLTHAMAVQMPHPEIAVTYDTNPEQAIRSRLAILDYVSKNKIPIAGMHIAYPAMGNITANTQNGYEFIPLKK